jgi:hypothetical protein
MAPMRSDCAVVEIGRLLAKKSRSNDELADRGVQALHLVFVLNRPFCVAAFNGVRCRKFGSDNPKLDFVINLT